MKTNLIQAMINLQTLRTMTNTNDTSIETDSMFQQLLTEAQSSLTKPTTNQLPINTMPLSAEVAAPENLQAIIENSAQKYGVSSNLITAIIKQESGFRENAVSKSGAMGLMQLMPGTAKSLGVTDPFDPVQNIDGGTKYISQLLDKYNGNVMLALAAYNAGPGNVDKYNGIPPFKETQNYVRKVLDNFNY